jgi:hypothetical protein
MKSLEDIDCYSSRPLLQLKGVEIVSQDSNLQKMKSMANKFLEKFGIKEFAEISHQISNNKLKITIKLKDEFANTWCPYFGTLNVRKIISGKFNLLPDELDELEILIAILVSPFAFTFQSVESLESHIRVRKYLIHHARKTAVAFNTEAGERPFEYWKYEEESGYTLRSNADLITALLAATQPETTGSLYDFSCYRASEYVILLAITQEAQYINSVLHLEIEAINRKFAIKSEQFHSVYLHEYGSMTSPLPIEFYVPGDRLWFKNPDEKSSDVKGFEGSWVFYLGEGLFSNFWNREKPYSLEHKCLEIYYWRDGVASDDQGVLKMDEEIVNRKVTAALSDPVKTSEIIALMTRYRDPSGVYKNGGCIDTTREYPRSIHMDCCEVVLPK